MTATIVPAADSGSAAVRSALHEAVSRLDDTIRPMAAYHLGWCDEHGRPSAADGGKSIRSRLTLLAARAAGGDERCAIPGAVAVEMVHNFSLVHDDLMDRDATRRHRPTVWAVWGDAMALLVGDAMLTLAHAVLLDTGTPRSITATRIIGTATQELIRGQAADIDFERRDDVSLAECTEMAMGKTAALLAAAAAIGGVLAGADPDTTAALERFGRDVGIAFQLVDDLLGIWGDPEVTGKPVFSDLRARKKTLPVTWAVESGRAEGRALAEWLARPGEPGQDERAAAAGLVEASGARRWARAEARRRITSATAALETADIGTDQRRELICLANYIVERSA